MGTSKVQGFN